MQSIFYTVYVRSRLYNRDKLYWQRLGAKQDAEWTEENRVHCNYFRKPPVSTIVEET